jgi:hypothetical protein
MPSRILKRTSFGLLRTNPKLSTNIKIIADSKNRIYLESIDANPFLSKSIYKGFEVSGNGSYSFDLSRFYSQGSKLLPSKIAYSIFEEDDSTTVKDQYNKQYDFTYGNGMYPKNSQLYTEEFSIFSPLWIEKDNVPEYFVIFKMEGPVTVNANVPAYEGLDIDTLTTLNSLVEDPENFFNNIIQNAYIIKTFDLTDKTEIGKYIRNHVNDPNFPEAPFYSSFDKGQNSYWQGISYDKGGFSRKAEDIYLNYSLVDKTIIESEDYITDGFRRNNVVCANLLTLEFLFDDEDQEKYKFSRYFGLYMNAVELGKFLISKDRLYEDRFREKTQLPIPILNNYGDYSSVITQEQYNEKGIKIYPLLDPSIYEGRLLSWPELQNSRFGYVKDTIGNLYSIDNINDWTSTYNEPGPTSLVVVTDSDYLRIKTKSIDWKTFGGFENPFAYIPSNKTDKKGRPAIAFKVVSAPNDGDEIRVRYTDWTNPKEAPFIDNHTIKGSSLIPIRQTNGLTFSTNGTLVDISISIVEAINNIEKYVGDISPFKAFYINEEILIISKIDSESWNKMKISFFSDTSTFPFLISNEYVSSQLIPGYQTSPINTAPIIPGKYLNVNFEGGNNNPGSRAIVDRENVLQFVDSNDTIYVKTNKGYSTTKDYGLYLDEVIYDDNGDIIGFKNYESYYVVNLADTSQNFEFGSSKKIALYKPAKNSNGYLSIFPIKDFDFDFHNTDYKKDADSYPSQLFDWYSGATAPFAQSPNFDWNLIGATGQTAINELIGPSSAFVQNGGFQSLIGYQDDLTDTVEPVVNEYDRLKENFLSRLALSSRVVPFINKWVYDNEGFDVRENGYRLNTDQSMGYNSFSPDFDQIEKTPKFFTHEWYYLQKYPPYMSFDQKLNSFSYFDEDIRINPTVLGPTGDSLVIPISGSIGSTSTYLSLTGGTGNLANLLSIEEDYFLNYFTRESITEDFGTYSVTYPIPREFKYSIFADGNSSRPAETMFRGIKVEILDRSEFSNINFNRESLNYVYGEKYNGYKFSAVLTYGNAGTQLTFIKNEKWKTVTLLIQADFNDILFESIDTLTHTQVSRFIDRCLLYVVEDKWIDNGGFQYTNKSISGLVNNWIDNFPTSNTFTVQMGIDANGNLPNLEAEITLNEDGGYNNIQIADVTNTYVYTFSGISNITSNTFTCESILNLPLLGNIVPNGARSLSNIQTIWGFLSTTYSAPLNFNPVYFSGGYNAYLSIIDSISFSSIQTQINLGDPEIRYLNVTKDGQIEENKYIVNLTRPDYPIKSSYLRRDALKKTSQDIQQSESILGYTLTALDRISLNPIARYRGSYTPRWRNVIQFIDTLDLIWEGLDFYNIQILDDLSYIKDDNLGKLKNVYFNKINVENPNIIITQGQGRDDDKFIYPKLGEIAIDYSDYYIFRSSWDPFYYRKYLKKDIFTAVIGTREPKEEKSFFGSKTISIPNQVRLQTFPTGIATPQEIIDAGSINNTDKNLILTTKDFASKTELDISVYVSRSLQDWLIGDGFGEEFIKYINPNFSFGDLILEDDIKSYIENNIFQRYVVKDVIFWEKIWVPARGISNPPQINTLIDDEQKISQGYKRSKNFKLILDEAGGLNFRVIYTVPRDKNTSIAFTVILEKK